MEEHESKVVRGETSEEIREESRVAADDSVRPPGVGADMEVVRTYSPARRAIDVVYLVFGVFDGLLLIRLLLKLLAANPDAPFTVFIYGVTDVLLVPFNGLLPNAVNGRAVFEPSVVIAILIYALIGWALAVVLGIVFPRSVMVASRRRTRRPRPGAG